MIHLRKGDCLQHERNFLCPHVCNNIGAFGAGFVAALNKVSDSPRKQYMKWHRDGVTKRASGLEVPFRLGEVQYVSLFDGQIEKIICNMIGQDGIGPGSTGNYQIKDRPPVRYWAIRKALLKVREQYDVGRSSKLLDQHDIVSPLFGAGLAGGYTDEIYAIIHDLFSNPMYPYYLYAFSDQDYENLQEVAKNFS